jgi:hypothetical protein
MNDYFNTFQNIDQSVEQLLMDEHKSLEIKQSAASLKDSVKPCIEELKQSATRLKGLVQVGFDDLYHAEDVWNSKPRIAEAAKSEIWEQLGEMSGCAFRIRHLASQCKEKAIKQAKKYWDERVEYLKKQWFFDAKSQFRQGIGWGDKEGFIKQLYPVVELQSQAVNEIIKRNLNLVYKEVTNIQLESTLHSLKLLDQQNEAHYSKQLDLIVSELQTKFSNPTEHLPNYLIEFKPAVSPDVKALVDQGWGDISWEDVVKFKGKVSLKTEKFITAIFDDRVELATKAITKAIAFYNDFLERQERYQQETLEQREAEKAWIDQQRWELEQVQHGIEAILNAS